MKLVFCCWLVLPIFNGAAYIYENYVRKYVKIGGYVSPNYDDEPRLEEGGRAIYRDSRARSLRESHPGASPRRIRIQDYRDFVFDKAYIVLVLRLRQIRLVQALTEAKKN
ncbi:HVA22-like protein f [Ananas comosus]|uniref:HVA22-like protein f n=1 Tax=Ananas comosus TaxID=4615 RepID=A0A199VND0_ANACO|nr:HVA22-like protein f [Ananas comosus]